jgi:XTP/dITP diphosphohydrolase
MSKQKLVIASGNKGKIREISDMLPEYEVISYKDLSFNEEIEETGSTFFENALIKAKTVSIALNADALADDSGLVVDALNGAPGIYSARYAGEHGNDKLNRVLLLKNLENEENRKAKFVSSVVLYKTDGTYLSGYGETLGTILYEEDGENGFGYDCIFKSDDLGVSFGVASFEDKNKVSHRFRALQDLYKKIDNE